jgi:hypothetical protein
MTQQIELASVVITMIRTAIPRLSVEDFPISLYPASVTNRHLSSGMEAVTSRDDFWFCFVDEGRR